MKNTWKATLACSIVVLLSLLISSYSSTKPPSYRSYLLRLEFEVENSGSEPILNALLEARLPLAHDEPRQTLVRASSPQPGTTVSSDYGETFWRWEFPIAPYARKSFQVEFEVRRAESGSAQALANPDLWSVSKNSSEFSDPALRLKAEELRLDRKEDTIKAIFNFVHDHISSSSYEERYRGAAYALRERKGDCSEFSSLFVALSRFNTIPARVMGGYVVGGNGTLGSDQYHNWAEYYLDGRWHVADAQRGVLDKEDGTFVAFHVLSKQEEVDSKQNDIQNDKDVAEKFSARPKTLRAKLLNRGAGRMR